MICCPAVVESAGQQIIQDALAKMPERCVAEVMTHADRFDQIFVQVQGASDSTPDLSDFQCVS